MEQGWCTRDEAITLIMREMNCSKTEAEKVFEEFMAEHPEAKKEIWLN